MREVDKDYRNHLQAFLNFAVQASKKAGKNKSKPVYSKFKQFFNYRREIERVKKYSKQKTDPFAGVKKHLIEKGDRHG